MAQSDVEGVVDARCWVCMGVCTKPIWFCEAGGGVSARVYAVDGCRNDGLFGLRAVEPGHAVAAALGPDAICGLHLVLSVPGARRGVEHLHGLVVLEVVQGGREGGWGYTSSTLLAFLASFPLMVGLAWVMTVLVDDPSVKVARAVYVNFFCAFDEKLWLHRWGREVGGVMKGKGEDLLALPWVKAVLFTETP